MAAVLAAVDRNLHVAPRTDHLVTHWPGDPAAAAMAMRLNAALHRIARRGDRPALSALYRNEHDDFDGAVSEALRLHDAEISAAMAHPTQTNEVSRAAAILSALMSVPLAGTSKFDLLELGASCGLNLNLARYAYELGGLKHGDPASPVRVVPEWRGACPPSRPVEIVSACGVDLNPNDPTDPATSERMLSYVWADQKQRLQRLELALDLARVHRPRVERASAGDWLQEKLRTPQDEGVCRAIFHSMVMQYLSHEERASIVDSIRAAGEKADTSRPLAWISLEWTATRSEVRLLLTHWPDGRTLHLATCHPYGAWIDWHADGHELLAGC